MEFLFEYGLFLAKATTIIVAIIIVAGSIASIAMRHRKTEPEIQLTQMNRQYDDMESAIRGASLGPGGQKQWLKSEKKKAKQKAREEKKTARESGDTTRPRLFVLDFDGDIRASDTEAMRNEISAILTSATPADEVLLRLESGGGLVHGYGLAASQLQRLRDSEIPLTIAVDKVAASGGYMMACVANRIIAAPFSIIGSIGVLAQIPNLHRFLRKHDVDFEQLSAGEYKRTLTLFGENTDKAREKMQQDLEETHGHFKDFISEMRPGLDLSAVATGETWLGTRALELGLVDAISTSDDYLMNARNERDLIRVEYSRRKRLPERIGELLSQLGNSRRQEMKQYEQPLLM
jgi:serine protease SohB